MTEHHVIKPSDAEYSDVNQVLEQHMDRAAPLDYDAVAKAYNAMPVGSLLFIQGSAKATSGNVASVLRKRGLDVSTDVFVTKPTQDGNGEPLPKEDRKVTLKKLTSKEMRRLNTSR